MFDKNIFINDKIADKNSEIMNAYFTLNKKLDNLMDFVGIVYNMSKFSKELHKVAHKAPLDADRFRDYNALYSFRTKYNTITGQYIEFSNPLEGVDSILEFLVDMDNMFAEAKAIAKAEENYDYNKFLSTEIKNFRPYKEQFITLHDQLESYIANGNTYQDFDFRCESYFNMA